MNHKVNTILIILILLLTSMFVSGCSKTDNQDEQVSELLLYLPFDEGEGTTVKDASGNVEDAIIEYIYDHGMYMERQDPQWRSFGIQGGSLLMDGFSTFIEYEENEIILGGESLSIHVWVAPRTFEWDDPNAAERGTEQLTGIVSQFDKVKKQGFILGYQRFGRLSFQVGTGDENITLWGNENNLSKYKWNLVSATFDGKKGEMCLYLNGDFISSKVFAPGKKIALAETSNLLVGRNSSGEKLAAGYINVHSGLIDELMIYQSVLSNDDVKNYYHNVKVPEIAFDDIWLQNILTTDRYKTQYHGGPYQNWMNEPHAPLYYNGMYHLFFQENISGPYWRNISWGHLISTDMVNWEPIKEAITPTEHSVVPDGVWSGGATYDVNGVPLLFFTAGNDNYAREGLLSNQNIGVAYPADLLDETLLDWIICEDLAIKQEVGQGRTGEFRDAHIWKEGGIWCMLICSGSTESEGGSALLYETDILELMPDGTVLMDWNYMGPVYEMTDQSVVYGTSWELPIILPVTNEAGTIRKHMFIISPAPASVADNKIYYYLGEFDVKTGKFIPDERFDNQPALLDYGTNVFTGPSAFVDPISDNIYMFSIMQDQRSGAYEGAAGWAHCVGLTRRIWLSDDGTDLRMSPIDALSDLQDELLLQETNISLAEINEKLSSVDEDMLYVHAIVEPKDALAFGLRLKKGGNRDETVYTYDMKTETISGETANRGDVASGSYATGLLPLEDGTLAMDIYIDRSLVEGFFNHSKSLSIRSYTGDAQSQGLEFFADGEIVIKEIFIASMKSIYS